MNYFFKYQATPKDLWQLSMYGIYGSMLGFINIVFTVAMILLTFKFFMTVNIVLKLVLLLGVSLFLVIQPLAVYQRAKKQMGMTKQNVVIGFDKKGVHVDVDGQTSDLKWHAIKGIAKKPSLVVVMTQDSRGYILTNQVLGDKKEQFYQDVLGMLKNK